MYGPDVTILLIYGSHDMRHVGFCRLTVVNGTPWEMGCHTRCSDGPKLLVRELKLVYSTRATSRC